MIRRATFLTLLLVLSASSFGSAPTRDKNTTRGFAGDVYQVGELDNVNVFNGNLTVRIPIGQTFTVGPILKYQFVLTNNSKVWDYELTPLGERRATPETYSDAGLGWTVALGRLLAPEPSPNLHYWTYVGSDGSHREFETPVPVNAPTSYTKDGSHLRLTLNSIDAVLGEHIVEFPDGIVQEFDDEGRLRLTRDRFGNWVKVEYQNCSGGSCTPCPTSGFCEQWKITDGFGSTETGQSGREHKVTFVDKATKYDDSFPNFQQVVRKVELAAFDSSAKSTYLFQYADDSGTTGTTIESQHCPLPHENDLQGHVLAPLLTSVTLPDGSQFAMQYVMGTPVEGRCSVGSLNRLTLPTGGAIAWKYGDYEMTKHECDLENYWTTAYGGVIERRVYSDPQAAADAVWTYSPVLGDPIGTGVMPFQWPCDGTPSLNVLYAPAEATRTVIGPSGKTVHYFSAYPAFAPQSVTNFNGSEYGLPLSRNHELGDQGTNKRALSTEVYACQQADCLGTVTLKQKTHVAYEHDGFLHGGPRNSRQWRHRVTYVGDNVCGAGGNEGCYVETFNNDYDGYGHYRETQTKSNFPLSVDRTSYTNHVPSIDPWIHTMYDEWRVTEGSQTIKTLSVFDTTKGVEKTVRTLRSTDGTLATSDLFSVACRNSRGFVTSERYFGGDVAGIPAGALPPNDPCIAGRVAGHYFINHTYGSTGTAITSHTAQYAGAAANLIADETFDTNTGRVKSSRDPAGIETTFEYDLSGRLTAVKPSDQASTTYEYPFPSNPRKLIVKQCPSAASTTPCTTGMFAESRFYYDGLGRLTEERRKMPGLSQWAALWTTYDGLGRAKMKSVPVMTASGDAGSNVSTASTSWAYDFLGRVLEEVRPDTSKTTFAYTGVRDTQVSVANPGGSAQLRSTERRDGAGRLIQVIQPSGPTSATNTTGAPVTTTYTYDVGNRLRAVTMAGGGADAPASQSRTFTYDGAGLLKQESHPESGVVDYLDYDARGHVGKRLPVGAPTKFKQQYRYDDAERLTHVNTGTPLWAAGSGLPEFRIEKAFEFALANDGANKKAGKLEKAIRENYTPCNDYGCGGPARIRVTETYRYDSVGRKAGRTTVIDDLAGQNPMLIKSIDQEFEYDEMGLPSKVGYPTCDDCGVPPIESPERDVVLTYTEGLLKTVDGYISGITYGATGTPTSVAHAHEMTDTTTLDSSGRPKTISFSSWSTCTPPSISVPPAGATIDSGTTATLSVSATGATQFQWYEATNPPVVIAGANQSTYVTPVLTATKSYFVRVTNACKSIDSATVTVTVTCVAPSVSPQPQSVTISSGTSTTLSVSVSHPSVSYQWYQGVSGDTSAPVGSSSPQFTTPVLTATTRFWVRVTRNCGASTNSSTVTVTVPLPTPTNLVAAKDSATTIRLTWTSAAGAAKYEVWRRWNGGSFSLISNGAQTPFIDSQVQSGLTYVYKVIAVDVNNGSASADSNYDLATVMTFSTVVANVTPVDDSHWQELLNALNAVRAANGDAALTWAGILPAGVPAPALNVPIRHVHIDVLRQSFTSARQVLGITSAAYTDPTLNTTTPLRAIHINELQGRAQ